MEGPIVFVKENVSLGFTTVPFNFLDVISKLFCLAESVEYILVENWANNSSDLFETFELEELDLLLAWLVETILLLIVLFDISFKLLISVDVLLTSIVLTSVSYTHLTLPTTSRV